MRQIRTSAVALIFAAVIALVPGAFMPASAGVGVQVYKTSKSGSYEGNVAHAGDTTDCCCVGGAFGTVGYGAKVCYLP